ncbi:unnamed protein product [Blepharisma stoltei]|uniref:Uncharacterized protein n=1 Tax=Blepharisma stoltei TaxID=1481888 RepID=A0AAU9JUA7_9CILI|nr:unnamed protein product [Blepharisma stoltei]
MVFNTDGICSCKTNELTYNTTTHTCNCPYGEYPDQQTGLCSPCQDTCADCVSYNICLSCIDNSILYNTGKGNCICQDGSKVYNNVSKSCVPCPNGNYPSFGVCYPCGSGCNSCSYYNECNQCYTGMHLSSDNTGCICNNAYTLFNPVTNTCEDCDPAQPACDGNCLEGCKICTSPGTCQTCYDAENMVSKNGECSCINTDQKYSFTKRKCVDNSSAQELALVWVLALYAAI